MKYINLSVLLALLLFISFTPTFGQDASTTEPSVDQSLKSQFQEILDRSETYAEYKVIKRTDLRQYSKAVQDSLQTNRVEISTLKNTVDDQKSQISQLSKRITELENQLAESEELRESLSLLGLNIYKTTYHLIVWLIIGVLLTFGIFAYTSFIRSNIITSKSIKEYKALEVEFEDHKKKSYEKQLKIGRELQTERNKIEELKTKIKAKTTGKP
jgi:peptidoglycan hydrolase CwlO-like protein